MLILYLALAGVLFSGYLSAVKLFSNTCAFNETCPYFLGYPACWFGFGMFLILFIAALWDRMGKSKTAPGWVQVIVSGLGICFAGYFTVPEVSSYLSGASYNLGLPTCAYGLIFYVIIFILAIRTLIRLRR